MTPSRAEVVVELLGLSSPSALSAHHFWTTVGLRFPARAADSTSSAPSRSPRDRRATSRSKRSRALLRLARRLRIDRRRQQRRQRRPELLERLPRRRPVRHLGVAGRETRRPRSRQTVSNALSSCFAVMPASSSSTRSGSPAALRLRAVVAPALLPHQRSSASSSSVNPGETPASTGRSRSRRAQKEWMVPAKKRSRFESARADERRSARQSGARVLASSRLERQLKPAAQLGRGLARERDRRHVLELVGATGDAGRHALGQLLRLAGAGAGLDEQVALELGDDARRARRASWAGLRLLMARQASRTAPGSGRPAWPRARVAPLLRRTRGRSRTTCSDSSSGAWTNRPEAMTSRRSPSTSPTLAQRLRRRCACAPAGPSRSRK